MTAPQPLNSTRLPHGVHRGRVLTRMPNGLWVRLKAVVSVSAVMSRPPAGSAAALESSPEAGGPFGALVFIETPRNMSRVRCRTLEQAYELRDWIAEEANAEAVRDDATRAERAA